MEAIKICASCGREVEWRRKWANCWEEVRFCSDRCRRAKPVGDDAALEMIIIQLLKERAHGKTICPSEAARRHFGEDSWRGEMKRTRQAARRLVASGQIEILQQGRVVDPSTARGPIRLRLTRRT